jgi:CDP-diacylglycerol--glycerol-3-phosphate 3-phosphatidyltransferase
VNVANLITVMRFPLLVVVVILLYFGGTGGQLTAAFLILVLILMDSLDGIAARRRGEQTLIGSALDIAADRAVEVVLWVVYAHLGLISVVIPLTVIVRGAMTDTLRNAALRYGYSAHSMMRSSWGRWLVVSSPMRTGYAVVKAAAFILMALVLGLRTGGHAAWQGFWIAGSVFSWVSLVVCVLRGLPVIIEAPALFRSSEFRVSPSN